MVTYDISDDRIRRKVHDTLKNHGQRVQFSVFECRVDEIAFGALREGVLTLIDPEDNIRWYPLCKWCREAVDWQGNGRMVDREDYYLV